MIRPPRFGAAGDPVISVDRKKKQLIGNFTASGREWEPAGEPTKTSVHDFVDRKLGKIAPYGVYDIAANTGWVNMGTDADTGAFAVESIRRWWNTMRTLPVQPTADQHLSERDEVADHRRFRWVHGSRLRLWKTELGALATETGLQITVCHLPPGGDQFGIGGRDPRAARTGPTDPAGDPVGVVQLPHPCATVSGCAPTAAATP